MCHIPPKNDIVKETQAAGAFCVRRIKWDFWSADTVGMIKVGI